ncbi:MAG: leucine-rich repeat domain-containing protein [Lachnospiraceae bacterium]|nr:leucine-rich repeat domain-containing protein [Lachnospiraceae bacterium]
MKRNKWIGVMVLSAAMMFGVTACGGGNKTGTDTVAQSEAQGAEEEADAQDTVDEDTVPVSDIEYFELKYSEEYKESYGINTDTDVTIDGCKNPDQYKTLVIPEEIDGHTVSMIGLADFGSSMRVVFPLNEDGKSYATVEKLVIPDTVKAIGNNGIGFNDNLKEVEFGNGIVKIDKHAFLCSSRSLEKLVLPSSLKSVGEGAFGLCTDITFTGENLEEYDRACVEGSTIRVPAGSQTEEVIREALAGDEDKFTIIAE